MGAPGMIAQNAHGMEELLILVAALLRDAIFARAVRQALRSFGTEPVRTCASPLSIGHSSLV